MKLINSIKKLNLNILKKIEIKIEKIEINWK